jgi:guanylate kinase
VVAGPFGCGKRTVLQRLVRELLPGVAAAAPVVTTKPRAPGDKDGEGNGTEEWG